MALTNPRYLNNSPGDASTARSEEHPQSLEWIDGTGRSWRLELENHRIALSSGTDKFEIPKDAWKRDIYVTPHNDQYIVRFETFDRGLVFSLTGPQARPLLEHLGAITGAVEQSSDEPDEPVAAKLLWPKVSPLAIWALISSGLVFLPVVGLLPALVTTALLLLHRARVRRSRAWSHSRAVCGAAVCYMLVGLVASALGTMGLMANKRASP